MTIDEAIKHCLEVAEENETKAQKIGVQFLGTTKDREATECRECAADHRQLAEWLTNYKEAIRLLKAAVEDFKKMPNFICDCTGHCENCPIADDEGTCQDWRYEKEALKLTGGSENER